MSFLRPPNRVFLSCDIKASYRFSVLRLLIATTTTTTRATLITSLTRQNYHLSDFFFFFSLLFLQKSKENWRKREKSVFFFLIFFDSASATAAVLWSRVMTHRVMERHVKSNVKASCDVTWYLSDAGHVISLSDAADETFSPTILTASRGRKNIHINKRWRNPSDPRETSREKTVKKPVYIGSL